MGGGDGGSDESPLDTSASADVSTTTALVRPSLLLHEDSELANVAPALNPVDGTDAEDDADAKATATAPPSPSPSQRASLAATSNTVPGGDRVLCIYKVGDDLRQDCLVMQLLQVRARSPTPTPAGIFSPINISSTSSSHHYILTCSPYHLHGHVIALSFLCVLRRFSTHTGWPAVWTSR